MCSVNFRTQHVVDTQYMVAIVKLALFKVFQLLRNMLYTKHNAEEGNLLCLTKIWYLVFVH